MYDLSSSIDLYRVIQTFKAPTPFWSTFFAPPIYSRTKEIAFEKVHSDYRRVAPFVAPNVQGRMQRREGSRLEAFRPAYLKPKDVVDPSELVDRMPAESINPLEPVSLQQRHLRLRGQILEEHDRQITNRVEWLGARALIDGRVTIEGIDYPTTIVDFNRDPSLTKILTGNARWGGSAATSLADIQEMRKQVKNLTGAVVRRIVFGADAWDAFYSENRELLRDLSNTQFRGSESQITQVSDGLEDVEYMGQISGIGGAGRLEFYVYSGQYIEQESGRERFHLQPGEVVGFNPEVLQLTPCYAAIMDARAGYQSVRAFPKNWIDEDPSQEYLMTQSAPLVVPGQPNASFKIVALPAGA